MKKFLNKKLCPINKYPTALKLELYVSVPFLVSNTFFYKKLHEIIGSNIPSINLKLIPKNPLTIKSLFNYKDQLNDLMTSNVVYKYSCPKCNFGNYVGATKRLLKVRIDSHKGISHRTGCRIKNPDISSIRDHSKKCRSLIEYKDFSIIGKVTNDHDLPILESIMIKQLVPSLNAQTSATQLYLA